MKRATFNVLFYLKIGRKMKDGTYPIYARITIRGKRVEFSLHHNILEKNWNPDKGRVRGFTPEVNKINNSLEFSRSKIYGYKLELEQQGIVVTPTSIKNKYQGINEVGLFERWVE